MEQIKHCRLTRLIVMISLVASSCSTKKTGQVETIPAIFVDSMLFRYHIPDFAHENPAQEPFLVSSYTYFYNDSMSNIFDGFGVKELQELGFPDRAFYNPLPCKRTSDTLMVSLLYSSKRGYYSFGKMNVRGDTIFLRFAGSATMRSHRLTPTTRELSPYVRTVFKVKVDSTVQYKVYFRMSDVDL